MRRIPLVALAGLFVLPAAPADAVEPWGAGRTIAGPARLASVAVDQRGTVAVGWTRDRGRGASVHLSRRSATGGFGAASELQRVARGDLGAPAIAFGADRTYLAWQNGSRIEGRTLGAGGSRSALLRITGSPPATVAPEFLRTGGGPLVLSWARGANPTRFELADVRAGGFSDRLRYALPYGDMAIDRAGTVSLAYTAAVAGERHPRVFVARREAGSADFSEPLAISDGAQYPREPAIAAARDGAVTVAWTESDGRTERVVSARRPAGGGAFAAPRVLDPRGRAYLPQIAITRGGETFVTWIAPERGSFFGGGRGPLLVARTGTSVVRTLARDVEQYALRADGPGGVTLAWTTTSARAQAASVAETGRFGRVHTLSRRGVRAGAIQLATGARGDAFAVWTALTGDRLVEGTRVEGARRPS